MSKVRLSFAGGFHNSPARSYVVENNRLTPEQAHKVTSHLCGCWGCWCGHMYNPSTIIQDQDGNKYCFDGDYIVPRSSL